MKPVQIMIVDDHSGVRSLIRELVEDCFSAFSLGRPEIVECDSAEQALQLLPAFTPALATVDLRLDGMDGLECVRRMRREVPGALIFVVTSLNGDHVTRGSLQAGADGVVFKEDLTALQEVIFHHLPLLLS